MIENAIKAGVLAVFALLLLLVNIKTNRASSLKTVTFIGMVATLIGTGYFVVLVVIA